jgi:hypothetical protein
MMTDFVGIAGGRFGLMDLDVGNGALRLRLLQNEPFSERQTQQSSERVLPKPSPEGFLSA